MRCINYLLSILTITLSANVIAEDIESYISNNYLSPDKVYGYKPINRYNKCSKTGKTQSYTKIKKFLESNNLAFSSAENTKCGLFVYIENNDRKNINTEKSTQPFYQGFIYITKDAVFYPSVQITDEDLDAGGYQKHVWDIIRFKNIDYILVFNRIYENHVFEYYVAENGKIEKVGSFSFGGL